MKSEFDFFQKGTNNVIAVNKLLSEKEMISNFDNLKNVLDFNVSIKNSSHRLQYLNSRYLALKLGELNSINNPIILKNENGKPYLKDSESHLSLSHSPFFSAVILSKNHCGVDIEYPREVIKKIQIKFLSPNELKSYKDDIPNLTLIWSLKESMYKMLDRPGLEFKSQLELIEINNEQAIMKYLEGKSESLYELKFKKIENHVLTYVDLSYRIQ